MEYIRGGTAAKLIIIAHTGNFFSQSSSSMHACVCVVILQLAQWKSFRALFLLHNLCQANIDWIDGTSPAHQARSARRRAEECRAGLPATKAKMPVQRMRNDSERRSIRTTMEYGTEWFKSLIVIENVMFSGATARKDSTNNMNACTAHIQHTYRATFLSVPRESLIVSGSAAQLLHHFGDLVSLPYNFRRLPFAIVRRVLCISGERHIVVCNLSFRLIGATDSTALLVVHYVHRVYQSTVLS